MSADNIIRKLENGMEVMVERVSETDEEIVFEFIFAGPTDDTTLFGLRELYVPGTKNDVIYQKLVSKGWVTKDGMTAHHFKMDVDRDNLVRMFKFRYYLVNPEETKV